MPVTARPRRKYSENRVFTGKLLDSSRRETRYFSQLQEEFVTWRNNGIFQTINEFEAP